MKYGCIGERLPHSFSKIIHARLASHEYDLCELPPQEVGAFLEKRDFCGINVTIPYKQTVIPYLDEIDDVAKEIGAVNTIVNRGSRLYGYNTDLYGMREAILHAGISLADKKVLILGTGGTSRTARAVAATLEAREVITVSRTAKPGSVSYADAYRLHADAEVIVNTTPCGMYPETDGCPIDIERFPALTGVVDAVYNPLRTELFLAAQKRGIAATCGLYMLVAQAVRASELFTGASYGSDIVETVSREILAERENLVLIGMPASGKTTVGAHLARLTGRRLIDADEALVSETGRTITEIFASDGEAHFRALEREGIRRLARENGCILATGGGAVLDPENIKNLKKNGWIVFLDRPLPELLPTSDRPTAATAEAIAKRYEERYELYCKSCDEHVRTLKTAEATAEEIIRRWRKK